MARLFLLAMAALAAALSVPAQAERVRDLGSFQSVRSNQLTGYGIVVGLDGTGDDSLAYLTQAMRGATGRFGLQLPPGVNPALKNAAAVMLTADLPGFCQARTADRRDRVHHRQGQELARRSADSDAALWRGRRNLRDGARIAGSRGTGRRGPRWLQPHRKRADRRPHPGWRQRGAQRSLSGFADAPELRWNLHQADFLTASRVRDAINAHYPGTARVEDGVTLALALPAGADARAATDGRAIEMLDIAPAEAAARVVVNSRTGTVVISSAVRLSPAAVSHGSLVVRIDEAPRVVQPAPFSDGITAVEPDSAINAYQGGGRVALMEPGASLAEVVDALNALGATPADLVAILEALKQAGSLKAEMVVL